MSVIIKSLDKPKTCMDCALSGLRSVVRCEEWHSMSAGLMAKMTSNVCPIEDVEKISITDFIENYGVKKDE